MSAGYTPKEITERPLFYPLLCLIIGILVWDYWILPVKTAHPLPDGPAEYEGVIVEPPRVKEGKIKITIEMTGERVLPPAGIPLVLVRQTARRTAARSGALLPASPAHHTKVLLTFLGEETPLRHGDRIRFTAKLKRPVSTKNPGGFDYARYLLRQGITATGFIVDAADIALTAPHQSFDYPTLPGGASSGLTLSGIFHPVLPDGAWVLSKRQSVWQKKTDALKERTRDLLLTLTSRPVAGILIALLWGDESLIDAGTEKLFRDHGVNHLLVISGLHFATIAFLLFEFFLNLGRLFPKLFLYLPMRKLAAGAAIIPLTLYFFFCESSPSVTRAFIAVTTYLTAMILNRPRDLLNIIFLAAFIILLIHPSDLFDLSFQLSFGAVLSLAIILPALRSRLTKSNSPHPPLKLRGGERGSYFAVCQRVSKKVFEWFGELILVNVAVFIGLTPVLAFYFHRFSADGFLMNLWAVPLFELVIVPIGLVALVFEIFLPIAVPFLFSLDSILVDAALWILNKGALFFGGPFLVYPPRGWELGFYLLLVLVLVLKVRPRPRRLVAGSIVLVFIFDLALRFHQIYLAEPFRVTQIDVGQGDSLLVQLPGPRRVLIDGGGSPFFDLGENVVIPFLLTKKIPKLDAVCVTHADADHYLGLQAVLESYRVDELWWNGVAGNAPAYRQLFETAKRKGVKIVELTEGMTLSTGPGDQWEVLSPNLHDKTAAKDNNRSVVLHLTARGKSALFTGDLESWGEFKLMRRMNNQATRVLPPAGIPLVLGFACGAIGSPPSGVTRYSNNSNLRADYLKVSHHGSRSSSLEEFLRAVSPVVATIGVGEKNRFHHPAREVVRRFDALKIPLYRTDRDGAIEVDFDGAEIQVKTYLP